MFRFTNGFGGSSLAIIIGAAVALAPSSARAQGEHAGDVLLRVNGGVVQTGTLLSGDPEPLFPYRVYGSEFGEIAPNVTDEPGFESIAGEFPGNVVVSLAVRRALRVWDGAGFPGIPEETITISKAGDTIVTPASDPASPEDFPSIEIGFSDPIDGVIHDHVGFTLDLPASDAVYLLEIEVRVPGFDATDPAWIVFNQNMPEEVHDAAIDWVIDNLAGGGCPCDFTGDGGVDTADFFEFFAAFFSVPADADVNGDGVTDTADFFEFFGCFFGAQCG